MSQSSDEDVIQRSRQSKRNRKVALDDIFDSDISESTNSEMSYSPAYDPIFLEVFGTGTEYAYIYDKEDGAQEPEYETPVEVNAKECLEYVRRVVSSRRMYIDGALIEMILEGYASEFIAFHCGVMDMVTVNTIKDAVEEYKEFARIKNKPQNVDTLGVFQHYKRPDPDLHIQGLLNVSEYVENLIACERIHEPRGVILFQDSEVPEPLASGGWEDEAATAEESAQEALQRAVVPQFQKVIAQLASNPVFIDRVTRHYKEVLQGDSKDEYSGQLIRMYTSDIADHSNEIRIAIVKAATDQTSIDREQIKVGLSKLGLVDGTMGYREILDLIVSVRGIPGTYAGIFVDRGFCKIVLLGEGGAVEGTAIYNDNSYDSVRSFVSGASTVLVTSTSESIKYFLQNIGIPIKYVPRELSFFNDMKDFSVAVNIASLVQSPVLYFSRLHSALNSNRSLCISHRWASIDTDVLRRAILTAAACVRLDWRFCIAHKYGYTFLSIAGISLTDKYVDYGNVATLECLRDIFSEVEFNNLCTFFYLPSSTYLLDRTFVHPRNYRMAILLCKGLYASHYKVLDAEDDEVVSAVLANVEMVRSIQIPDDAALHDDMIHPGHVKNMLLRPMEVVFAGATDRQIFDDVVSRLEVGAEYKGAIKKVGGDFYLVDAEGATIYIKKNGLMAHALNQLVVVKITNRNDSMLSYTGEFADCKSVSVGRYKKHALFRNMDPVSLQEHMETTGSNVLIRPSSAEDALVVVCRADNGLFYSFRLRESIDANGLCYLLGDTSFESIDSFIHRFIRKMYHLLYEIKGYKYYFGNIEDARRHIDVPGDYLKYAILLSREYVGFIELLMRNKKMIARIEGGYLSYKSQRFGSLSDFIRYVKSNFN